MPIIITAFYLKFFSGQKPAINFERWGEASCTPPGEAEQHCTAAPQSGTPRQPGTKMVQSDLETESVQTAGFREKPVASGK